MITKAKSLLSFLTILFEEEVLFFNKLKKSNLDPIYLNQFEGALSSLKELVFGNLEEVQKLESVYFLLTSEAYLNHQLNLLQHFEELSETRFIQLKMLLREVAKRLNIDAQHIVEDKLECLSKKMNSKDLFEEMSHLMNGREQDAIQFFLEKRLYLNRENDSISNWAKSKFLDYIESILFSLLKKIESVKPKNGFHFQRFLIDLKQRLLHIIEYLKIEFKDHPLIDLAEVGITQAPLNYHTLKPILEHYSNEKKLMLFRAYTRFLSIK